MYRYNESGSNGIYYVNYSSDKLFSYDSINYNYTLRVILNSNKEIEHVVTDKNLESYIEEILVTDVQYEIENVVNIHADNTDIHFSKSEIEDTLAEIKVRDLTQEGSSNSEVQGIAYAQICAATYNFAEKSYLKSIRVPQNHTRTDYTKDNVYLVIHGDITGNGDGDWVFVTCSTNTQYQEAGGEDMVFEFVEGIDLGAYKRCRFFYSLTNEGEIALPTVGSNFNGVKMAFAARVIDTNCWIMQSGGGNVFSRAFPAIISYFFKGSTINHKDNEDRHVTKDDKLKWNAAAERIAELEAMVATLTAQLTQLTSQN